MFYLLITFIYKQEIEQYVYPLPKIYLKKAFPEAEIYCKKTLIFYHFLHKEHTPSEPSGVGIG